MPGSSTVGPWRIALALCMAVPFAVMAAHDLGRSFITTPDQDIVLIYEALRLNAGLAQHYDDHTGYTTFVLLAWWFKLAKLLGFVTVSRLDQLPPPGPAFDAAYSALVIAGRLQSALLSSLTIAALHGVVRQFAIGRGMALLLTAAFAVSEGLARQTLILRTELAAMLFTLTALAFLLAALRAPRRPEFLMAAGITVVVALAAKMQAIFLVAAFPTLALILSEPRQLESDNDRRRLQPETVLWLLTAGALAIPAAVMITASIVALGHRGLYQCALVVYGLTATILYGRMTGMPRDVWWRGLAALVSGLALGQLFHLLYHTPATTMALANFVEHMSRFSGIGPEGQGKMASVLVDAVPKAVRRHLVGTIWPVRLIEAVVVAALALRLRHGEIRLAVRGAVLFGLGLFFELLCSLRGFMPHYLIFTEAWPLIALAAMEIRHRVLVVMLAVAIIGAALHLGDPGLVPVQPSSNACAQANYMTIAAGFCR